jgi:hypothetical protein
MAEFKAQSKRLCKPIRRDIADLKIKLVFLLPNWVQKGLLGRLSKFIPSGMCSIL